MDSTRRPGCWSPRERGERRSLGLELTTSLTGIVTLGVTASASAESAIRRLRLPIVRSHKVISARQRSTRSPADLEGSADVACACECAALRGVLHERSWPARAAGLTGRASVSPGRRTASVIWTSHGRASVSEWSDRCYPGGPTPRPELALWTGV